jgi:hypothetical protein
MKLLQKWACVLANPKPDWDGILELEKTTPPSCWGKPEFERKLVSLALDSIQKNNERSLAWDALFADISEPGAVKAMLDGLFQKGLSWLLLNSAVASLDYLPSADRQAYLEEYVKRYQQGFFDDVKDAPYTLGTVMAVYPGKGSAALIWGMVQKSRDSYTTEALLVDYVVVCFKTGRRISDLEFDAILAMQGSSRFISLWELDGLENLLDGSNSRQQYRSICSGIKNLRRQNIAGWITTNYSKIRKS